MRLVNGHTHSLMNPHWAKQLEPCKCGSKQMLLYWEHLDETVLIRCGACARAGTPMPTIEGAIQTFKMAQLIS